MKQYTITEENDWEGETFGYILELTEEKMLEIRARFEEDEFEACSIEESNYDEAQVKLINKHSDNSYMNRLAFYKLQDNLNIETVEYNDFPYKGNGMIEIR